MARDANRDGIVPSFGEAWRKRFVRSCPRFRGTEGGHTPWLIASAYLMMRLPPLSVRPSSPHCHGMMLHREARRSEQGPYKMAQTRRTRYEDGVQSQSISKQVEGLRVIRVQSALNPLRVDVGLVFCIASLSVDGTLGCDSTYAIHRRRILPGSPAC